MSLTSMLKLKRGEVVYMEILSEKKSLEEILDVESIALNIICGNSMCRC